jgi:ubiquitin-conjugating enzyme E2 variant
VLLGELEKAEKGNTDMSISYGLVTADDITLTDWQCTILGPQNCGVEGRIISLLIRCPPKYPIEMPHIQFQSKINYPWLVSGSRR